MRVTVIRITAPDASGDALPAVDPQRVDSPAKPAHAERKEAACPHGWEGVI